MNWIDDTKAFLLDKNKVCAIVTFFDSGIVELLPIGKNNGGWKKPKQQTKYGGEKCHRFELDNKERAVEIISLLEEQL